MENKIVSTVVDLPKLRSIVGHSPYSWHQLYKKAKLGRSSYRYWNGTREFPLDTAIKIAYILHVPLSSFVNTDMIWLIKQVIR